MKRRIAPLILVLLAPNAAAAATPSKCSSKLSAARVTQGQKVSLTGRVKPHKSRPVRLQQRSGARWVTAARKRSRKSGRFTFALPTSAPGAIVVRVRVPRTKTARAVTCLGRSLTVVAPGAAAKPSFLAIYATASGATADAGKVAAIRATIDAADGWYATQTNGGVRPRWVRDRDGAPEVTSIQVKHTAAEFAAAQDGFGLLIEDLAENGLPAKGQKLAVFIDVTDNACGKTGRDVTVIFEAACDIHPASPTTWPYDATYLLAHELTHNFGAVPDCAPNAGGGGHVLDDPRDVLYNGPQGRDWDNQMLDPGHDDYYATGRSDCPGIEASPYWTATSDPAS